MEESIEYEVISAVNEPTPEPSPESGPIPETALFPTLKFKIPNFPSLDKSPQYYIDRYNNESIYKSWFDSQFPNDSIYNVLGYANPVSVPDWIRNNADGGQPVKLEILHL